MADTPTNGWSRAEMYVLEKLDDHGKKLDGIETALVKLAIRLEQKSAIWGAVAGLVAAIMAMLLKGAP